MNAKTIFPTKLDLANAMYKVESFIIEFRYTRFDLVFEEGDAVTMRQRSLDGFGEPSQESSEVNFLEYGDTSYDKFLNAIWAEVKDYQTVINIWIDDKDQDLDKMARATEIKEAKKELNKTQIKDNTIGLVSVMNAVDAKLVLEGDDLLTQLMDHVGSIITRRRAVSGYGKSEWCMEHQMDDVMKVQEVLNKISHEMSRAKSMDEVRDEWANQSK